MAATEDDASRRPARPDGPCFIVKGVPRSRKLAAVPDAERELDELYALPASEFTAARDELAKRLRAAGQAEEADAVKALRRPTASAALVNRLAREHPAQVRELLDAAKRLRQAHARGGDALRRAVDEERAAVEALAAQARKLEPDASDATLTRVGATLRAAAGDEEMQALLERGRLSGDVEAQGFEALAGLTITAPTRASAPKKPKRDRRQLDAARKRVRELRQQSSEAQRAADQAARELERAEAALRALEEED